jgi:protein required for attachment to host cells
MTAAHKRNWIVIADGARARIVTPLEERKGYQVIQELESAEARLPNRDLVSDGPGRVIESGSSARHAVEPKHDPHEAKKLDFLDEVVDFVHQAGVEGRYDELIVFAPPRCLSHLRGKLETASHGKVAASYAKDLTKIPLSDLPKHLAGLVKEPHPSPRR